LDSSVLKELKFLIFLSLSGKVFHNRLALNLVDLVPTEVQTLDKCNRELDLVWWWISLLDEK